jgi:transposase
VEQWRNSGLTARAFAERHGVSERSLGWWKWRLGSARDALSTATGTPKRATTRELSPLTFVEMTSGLQREPIEVILASGVRIRIPSDFDASAMTRLLDILERRS